MDKATRGLRHLSMFPSISQNWKRCRWIEVNCNLWFGDQWDLVVSFTFPIPRRQTILTLVQPRMFQSKKSNQSEYHVQQATKWSVDIVDNVDVFSCNVQLSSRLHLFQRGLKHTQKILSLEKKTFRLIIFFLCNEQINCGRKFSEARSRNALSPVWRTSNAFLRGRNVDSQQYFLKIIDISLLFKIGFHNYIWNVFNQLPWILERCQRNNF